MQLTFLSYLKTAIANRLQEEPSAYLKRMYFDAVSYSTPALESLITQVGADRIMFGTDNPFFPPLDQDINAEWPSTVKVYKTLEELSTVGARQKILITNAQKILGLL